MKRKINKLRGKRLVTGDPNLVTMNEIHVKDTSEGVEITERDKNGKLVNINMPSGGGESGGESGGGLTYYRFPSYASLDDVPASDIAVVYNAARLRIEMSGIAQIGVTFIGGGKFMEDNILGVRAFAIDKRARYIMVAGGQKVADMTLEEYLAPSGVSFSNYEEITEEEFYAL